jgi:hypothetical protein
MPSELRRVYRVPRCFDLDVSGDRSGDTHPIVRPHPALGITHLVVENSRQPETLADGA